MIFEPLRSALVRLAAVKSMRAWPRAGVRLRARVWLGLEPPPPQSLHLRVRARELRVETHIESRVEIDRAWAIAQQAVQLGAATGGTGGCWLECSVREVVRGEVERLE